MLLAQLTDTHILEPGTGDDHLFDNERRLAAAVERLNRESVRPDAILATGDLTDHGTELEMDLLLDLLAPLEMPVLAIPGNHDVRETFAPRFDLPWASDTNLSWMVDVGEVRVVGLDTITPGSHGSTFDDERREWLEGALSESTDRPVLIAMHHPPFPSGIVWMDDTGLVDRETFAEVVAGHPNVERIVCGHLHRPMTTTVGGVTTSTGPATAHHVDLDLDPKSKVAVIRDPGGYHLHHRTVGSDGDGGWVSHIRYIETGEEPVTPSWAD